jgi:hypothetical protein
MGHQIMTWEHTVKSKRAAREEFLDAGLLSLPLDVAGPIDFERTDGQTLISKLAGGEVTAERVTTKAIHK